MIFSACGIQQSVVHAAARLPITSTHTIMNRMTFPARHEAALNLCLWRLERACANYHRHERNGLFPCDMISTHGLKSHHPSSARCDSKIVAYPYVTHRQRRRRMCTREIGANWNQSSAVLTDLELGQ